MLDINTSKAKRPKAVMTTVNSPYSLSAFESMPSGCCKVYNKDQYIFEKYNQQIVSYCLTTSSIYMQCHYREDAKWKAWCLFITLKTKGNLGYGHILKDTG